MKLGIYKILAASALLSTPLTLGAATNTWTGGTDGNWNTTTAGNWSSPTTWANGNDALFDNSGANRAITVGSGVELLRGAGGSAISFTANGYSLSGAAITMQAGGGDTIVQVNGSGNSATVNNFLDYLGGGNLRLTAGGGATLNVAGGASLGSSQLQLSYFGGGTVNLTGGTYTTTHISNTGGNVNFSGNAVLNTHSYTLFQGKTTVNGAGASIQSTTNSVALGNNLIGQSGVTGTKLELVNGSVNYATGAAIMNASSTSTGTASIDVQGGSFTAGGPGLYLIRNDNASTDRRGSASYTQSGGVSTVSAITFGLGTATAGDDASVALSGGELYVGSGGISKNAAFTGLATSITLSGGTLGADADWSSNQNMTLSNTNGGVTFKTARENNTSQNITLSGVLSGGGPVGKTGSGTLLLQGVNTYTGNTVVSEGTLQLGDDARLTFVIGANGVNNGISGTGTAIFDGDFTFNLSGADTNGTWTIVNSTLIETFNPTFQVFGWTDNLDNTWSTIVGGSTYTFNEGNGILTAVPEPSTYALMGLGMASLWILKRRNRRS